MTDSTNLTARLSRPAAFAAMRSGAPILSFAIALALVVAVAAQARSLTAHSSSALRIRPGGYAQRASEVTFKSGTEEYSNGAVVIKVAKNRRTITFAGVACYTGPAPTGGLPRDDVVSIAVPRHLTIGHSGTFAFSGPVTLTPEDSQSEQSFTTTFTIKGRFQNGKIAVTGTDSSPICQPTTVTHFKLSYAPGA